MKRALWVLGQVVIVVGLCEAVVMAILHGVKLRGAWIVLIDPLLLAAISGPLLYYIVIRPIRDALRESERDKAALEESERKFDAVQAMAHVGCWERYPALNDDYWWSDELYRISGRDPATFKPTVQSVEDLLHPEDRAAVSAAYEAAAKGDGRVDIEHRILRPDGTLRILHAIGTVQKDAEGNAVHIFGTSIDVTEQKRAGEALRESEKRYRLLAENATDEISTLDLHGVTTYTSPSVYEMRGFTPEEAMGQKMEDRMTAASVELARNSTSGELLGEGRGPEDRKRMLTLDLEHKCKDGSTVWLEVRTSLMLDSEGLPIGYLSVARDITERRRVEEALRESEERFRTLSDSSPMGVFHTDEKGAVLYTNPRWQEITGLTFEESLGFGWATAIHPDDKDRVLAEWEACLREAKGYAGEFRFLSASGEVRWVYTRTAPIRSASGDVVGNVGVNEDITERKRAEEERVRLETQMQQAQKLESLGVMAGGIAHDFNNLLMSILGNADLALMDMPMEAIGRERVGAIEKTARRAAELTNQMLAYSGHGAFDVGMIDLSKLVEEMAHLLEVSHSKKAILNYAFAESLPAVKADASQLRQVVMNLITNASEAIGEEGGFVRVSTGVMHAGRDYLANTYIDDALPAGEYVYLEVSDTGCGMDEETRTRLFDPFFTTKFTGRGLGLAAVLGIVRGHKGALRIDSIIGEGTTFRVLFPAHSKGADEQDDKKDRAPEGWWKGGTVLLVDDEEIVRELVEVMLERAGFSVVLAADGYEAVEVFEERSEDFVCVFLDLTMPRMGGEEALGEFLRIRPDICVVLSSGYSEKDLEHRFAGKGLAGFIQKPYQYEELVAKLRQVLDV